jgi:hypothetical protein
MTALGRHCADTHSILLTDEISRHHPARRPLGAYIGVHHGKRRKNPGLFMDGPTSGLTSSGLVTLEARETNPPRKSPELALQRLAVGDSKTLSLPQRVTAEGVTTPAPRGGGSDAGVSNVQKHIRHGS